MKLTRTTQCAKCPWKVSTDPRKIPGEYCETKHKNLAKTIADPAIVELGTLQIMACHHSREGDNMMCVGWVYNQLGVGNNIGLRLRLRSCTNLRNLRIIGKQHERFEDTLPK